MNRKRYFYVCIISVIINALFVALGGYVVYSRGGLSYVAKTFAPKDEQNFLTPHYVDKKDIFKAMPLDSSKIIFLGDSITENCGWAELFQDIRMVNQGISSDTTLGVLDRLKAVADSKPSKIFIMIGVNDLAKNRSIPQITASYRNIIAFLKEETPNTEIYIQSVLPINNAKLHDIHNIQNIQNKDIEALNEKLKILSTSLGVQYINLYPLFLDQQKQLDSQYSLDGLHLNGKGYILWKDTLIACSIKDL